MTGLFPYQEGGADWLSGRKHAMLADEMGLGKTVQAIRGADLIGALRILVLCPPIARANWLNETMAWQIWPRRVAWARGLAEIPALINTTDVLILPHHAAALKTPASVKARQALLGTRWDVIVVDEAHAFKSPESRRARVLYGQRFDGKKALCSTADHVWLLTGTPMPNNPAELWTHSRALWPEALGTEQSYQSFTNRYCVLKNDGFKDKIVGSKNMPELVGKLRPFILRRSVKDVNLELPPLRWAHVVVSPDKVPPRPVLTAEEQLIIQHARDRIAAGDEKIDELAMHLTTMRRWTGIAKAPAVLEMLQGERGKVVVFYIHNEVVDFFDEPLRGHAGRLSGNIHPDVRNKIIKRFQDPDDPLRYLFVQLSIGATAITLTAAKRAIFAETDWVPANVQQAAKRIHRIGQTEHCLVQLVSLAGSIDEAVHEVILRKAAMSKQFVSLVSEELAA